MDKELERRCDQYAENDIKTLKIGTDLNYRHRYIPKLVFFYVTLHVFGFVGLYCFFFKVKWGTFIWGKFKHFFFQQSKFKF